MDDFVRICGVVINRRYLVCVYVEDCEIRYKDSLGNDELLIWCSSKEEAKYIFDSVSFRIRMNKCASVDDATILEWKNKFEEESQDEDC